MYKMTKMYRKKDKIKETGFLNDVLAVASDRKFRSDL